MSKRIPTMVVTGFARVGKLLTVRRKISLGLFTVGAFWIVAIAAGFVILLNYENSPGREGARAIRWNDESRIYRDPGRPTLVMFAHPRCPCTRASIGELASLMTECQGLVSAQVVFFKPPGSADEWAKTDLWRSAAAIPGVTVRTDEGGREATRFHAETSGYTVLYHLRGDLLFSGGITRARGHSGENEGRLAIVALLHKNSAGQKQTPIFGCSILNPELPCKRATP